MKIIVDALANTQVVALLEEHLVGMTEHSPPGCIHALDLDRPSSPRIPCTGNTDSQIVVLLAIIAKIHSVDS